MHVRGERVNVSRRGGRGLRFSLCRCSPSPFFAVPFSAEHPRSFRNASSSGHLYNLYSSFPLFPAFVGNKGKNDQRGRRYATKFSPSDCCTTAWRYWNLLNHFGSKLDLCTCEGNKSLSNQDNVYQRNSSIEWHSIRYGTTYGRRRARFSIHCGFEDQLNVTQKYGYLNICTIKLNKCKICQLC